MSESNNPHPLWRQEMCEWCKAGVIMSADPLYHWDGKFRLGAREDEMRCTAPTEAEYIAQLESRIAELEKDKARLELLC